MPVNSAAVGRVIAHGASDAQAQAQAQGGGPSPGAAGTPAAGGSQGAPSSAAPGSAASGAPAAAAGAESSEGHGALAKVGAVFGAMTSAEQSLSTLLSGIPMPAFPAARITDTAVGIPHAHSHPPNLIPPAPPVPFPVTGPIIKIPFVSGADFVLINNLPAARCGDMGVNIWCGGFFPLYEIFLGSSSVWIEGARAARLGVDMTKHCVFSTPKPNDLPLGPPIGAIVTGSPNVIIGGVPLPSLTNMAVGLAFKAVFKGIGKVVKAVRAARAAATEVSARARGGAKAAAKMKALRKANPGPVFKTQKGAAKAALEAANPVSIAKNKELGGLIYRDAHGKYGYTGPIQGGGAGVNPAKVPAPKGTKVVGDYHTHGDYSIEHPKTKSPVRTSDPLRDDFNSNQFSPDDKTGIKADAKGDPDYRGYLGTPSGDFKSYDPKTNKVRKL